MTSAILRNLSLLPALVTPLNVGKKIMLLHVSPRVMSPQLELRRPNLTYSINSNELKQNS